MKAQNLLQFQLATSERVLRAAFMQTVESLKLQPVWVHPDHMALSARILLDGHKLRALAVVRDGILLGIARAECLALEPEGAPVTRCLEQPALTIEASTPSREAAKMFVERQLEFAPVVRDGQFVGMLTSNILLKELGRSWDPLTGLSWSDYLREWGIANLQRGNEITILFIDLDDFGQFNKRYGHVVGDQVLRRISAYLQDEVDPDRDILVRFGGDEFAIGTIRTREEAEDFAGELSQGASGLTVPDAGEPAEFSVGVFGGKRTREREDVHFAATMDNLINLASRAALAQKSAKRGVDPATPVARPKLRSDSEVKVVSVFADDASPTSMTQVIIQTASGVVSGVSSRAGKPVADSIADAAVKAMERAFAGNRMQVLEIDLSEAGHGERLVSLSGQFADSNGPRAVSSVISVTGDVYSAVAEAAVSAFLDGIRGSATR